jgi:hypothetical protein
MMSVNGEWMVQKKAVIFTYPFADSFTVIFARVINLLHEFF